MTLDLLNNFLSNLPEGFIGNNTHADLIQQIAGQADAKANEYKPKPQHKTKKSLYKSPAMNCKASKMR